MESLITLRVKMHLNIIFFGISFQSDFSFNRNPLKQNKNKNKTLYSLVE